MNDKDILDLKAFVEKFDQMKKSDKMDLSSDQDLSFAVMNLISIEEHLIFSGAKTEKTLYYDWVDEVRSLRKKWLKRLVKNEEGEVWCISKHLLASTMRLMEVGTKQLTLNNHEEAYDLFRDAYETYSLFWGLNLGVVSKDKIGKVRPDTTELKDEVKITKKTSIIRGLGELVKRAINCCLE